MLGERAKISEGHQLDWNDNVVANWCCLHFSSFRVDRSLCLLQVGVLPAINVSSKFLRRHAFLLRSLANLRLR